MSGLVGFAGVAGSGKDTAARVLIDAGWSRIAFADPIKALARDINPAVATAVARLGWDGAKRAEPGVREFLQSLGAAGRRHLGDDVWVTGALGNLRPPAVVTDVRMESEARAIRDRGGLVLLIERPGVGAANGDITERRLPRGLIDAVVQNDGTIAELHARVQAALGGGA